MQLFAANGRDLFFRRSNEGAGGVGGVEQSVLNRRATDGGVGAAALPSLLEAATLKVGQAAAEKLAAGGGSSVGGRKGAPPM